MSESSPSWVLLAVIRVDPAERVQCQCKNCGHSIYAAIHIVQMIDQEIQCWGQDCYEREMGVFKVQSDGPRYPEPNGRKLSADEREMLRNNREELIAKFKAEHETQLEAARKREQAARKQMPAKAGPSIAGTSSGSSTFTGRISVGISEYHVSLPRFRSSPVDHTQPRADEPIEDPLYREIREKKIKDWQSRGIDLTMPVHFNSLIENCRRDFERAIRRQRFR